MAGDKKFMTRIAGLLLGMGLAAASIAQPAPVKGGALNMVVQPEPPTLVLGNNTQGPTLFAGGQIYQSLLTYAADLKPLPSLAKAWTISDDGLTYTFDLQPNAKWHDGKPFTADDVVFTATTFLAKSHPRWRLIYSNYVDSVTATNPNQVVFKLKSPFSAFINAFELGSMPIMPKHIYEGTDFTTNPANQHPIGTGPFKFKEWKRGSYIHLVRNEDYWKPGLPYLDELYFRVIPDSALRALAFEQGTVDVLRGGDVEGFEVRRLQKLKDVQATTAGWEIYAPLVFLQINTRKPPFDNVKVRQALMYALNRNFITQNIYFGLGKTSTGPFARTTLHYSDKVTPYEYDLKKARELIKEAGVKPADTTIQLLPLPYGPMWDRMGEYVKQQWEQLGFKVNLMAVDAGGWAQNMSDWNFDVGFSFTYQYGHPALGVARHYVTENIIKGTPYGNNGGYSNPKVDALFKEAAAAVDPEVAAKAYLEAQKIVVDEVPSIWLFDMHNVTLSRPKVHNLVRTAIGLNEAMDEVWIEPKAK